MFRYVLPVDDRAHTFELTHSPVHVAVASNWQARGLSLEFWAEHDDDIRPVPRTYQVFGTLQPLPPEARWRATALDPGVLAYHLYELCPEYGDADG